MDMENPRKQHPERPGRTPIMSDTPSAHTPQNREYIKRAMVEDTLPLHVLAHTS